MFEELKLPGAQQDGVVTGSGVQLQREHIDQGVAPSTYLLLGPHSPYLAPSLWTPCFMASFFLK